MQRIKLELKLLWSGWTIKSALLLFFLAGCISAGQGAGRVEREAAQVDYIKQHYRYEQQQWQTKAQAVDFDFDFGAMGYYLFAPTFSVASPWAALISGQRDSDMLKHRIRLLAISGQMYASEIHNPNIQAIGYLDLAFIFVYILPLMVGLLSARLLADEIYSRRWPMIAALSGNGKNILSYRLILRFFVLALMNILLLLFGMYLAEIPCDQTFFFILCCVLAYQLFWFAICGFIIRWRLNSVNSHLAFVSTWLVLVLIVPGLSSLYLNNVYQVDSGIDLAIKQRQSMHTAWDKDKQTSLDEYLSLYPVYADTAKLPERFHWKWYFAMQHMSDLAIASEAQIYRNTISARYSMAEKLMWLSPPMHLQQLLQRFANTDVPAQQDYLQQIEAYHAQLREFYYARLFYDKPVSALELKQYPHFTFRSFHRHAPWGAIIGMLFIALLLMVLSMRGNIN